MGNKVMTADFIDRLADKAQVLRIHKHLHGLEEPFKEVFSLRIFAELTSCMALVIWLMSLTLFILFLIALKFSISYLPSFLLTVLSMYGKEISLELLVGGVKSLLNVISKSLT